MKKWILAVMVVSFVSLTLLPPAYAGDKSRHRWQGVAIGAASMLLLDHMFDQRQAPIQRAYYDDRPSRNYDYGYDSRPFCPPGHYKKRHYPRHHAPRGHWETVWIPGHYDSSGKYIDGHNERYYVEHGWNR